jgi:hypothetical protein
MKIFMVELHKLDQTEQWLAKHVGPKGFRWWTERGYFTLGDPVDQDTFRQCAKLVVDLTEEERHLMTLFLLGNEMS